MAWPLAGNVSRLAVVAGGGWIVVHALNAPATAFLSCHRHQLAVYTAMIRRRHLAGPLGAALNRRLQTTAPNSAPTPAVMAMASAPRR